MPAEDFWVSAIQHEFLCGTLMVCESGDHLIIVYLYYTAVGSESGTVSIFSAKGGWVLCHQLKLGNTILSTSWCPAGRYLAVTGENKVSSVSK